MAYSAPQIANAFLARASREGDSLTNMKLQKLLYFAQGHSLAVRGESLIREEPEAWDYGPVYTSVWREFRDFGAAPINRLAYPLFPFDAETGEPLGPVKAPDDGDVNNFLDAVWNAYKGKSAIQLSKMSHVVDGPWDQVRRENRGCRDATIPTDLLADYFQKMRKVSSSNSAED